MFAAIPAVALTVSILANAPAPVSQFDQAVQWGTETLAAADYTVPANVQILYTDTANCGAEISPVHAGGCTYTLDNGTRYVVTISPELANTAWGMHVLFHELGHTRGMNECEAEDFAHNFETPGEFLWAYPDCQL